MTGPREGGFATDSTPQSLGAAIAGWWARVKTGDLGSLPIIVGIAVIAIVFGLLSDTFFTPRNFTNLLLQMAGTALIAIGIVFILLIAEIDLAVAYNSAVGGVVMTLLLRPGDPGWPWPLAIGAALLITNTIGVLQAFIITRAGVPSFVVTLAGNLALSGVVLILTTEFSTAGTIVIQDPFVLALSNSFLSDALGWLLGLGAVAFVAVAALARRRRRIASGLQGTPFSVIGVQVGGFAVVVLAAIGYANSDRGIPMAFVILLAFLVLWTFVADRTRFGRHVYAVGGNPEAARRAGIDIDRVRVLVFAIGGLMAGVGGIILASRLRSVATNAGGGNLLLNVIAAAVIGGTSLFGGSGRVVSALLGAIVIASVDNGMGLLNLPSGVKFLVTGLVLLAAVLVDAFSRKSRAASGLA